MSDNGMKVQTFIGKLSVEGLSLMDDHINTWMQRENIRPATVTQTCGAERHHDGNRDDPVLITSIWYVPSAAS